ncbi:MAG: lysophospholipid acyltransferase family protein [Candidatus Izemoplasmatales bacterium]|jgi:1-acyl-sn-glycerol-3-phosphate acyltransferase|nr:lysophospholipid acyltransferase family protein [Candidatus Izemoplasmatales bacterium]MDD4987350.1 lysophospholipid acyltransferase family protein [Candidatus Izemoplasmatales bacterium]
MILFSIQLILTVLSTIAYAIFGSYPQGILGILVLAGIALVAFLGVFVCYFISGTIYIILNTKTDPKNMGKHRLYNEIGSYLFRVLLRVRIVASGLENLPKNNCFVAFANHSELSDPVYLKQILKDYPMAFLAKEELFHYPILKQLLISAGCIPLFRGMDRKGLQAIIDTIKAIKNGQPMGIFPEGTRSYSNQMIPFKAGAFKVALKAGADICPVCLYNMQGVLSLKRIRCHTAYIHVCPLIPYESIKEMDTSSLAQVVQERIQIQMDQFEAIYGQQPKAEGQGSC